MDLISWIGVVSGLVGSLITIVVGMRKFHLYVVAPILNHFQQCAECFASVAEMKKKLEYELNPNGGKSLRDELRNSTKLLSRLESLTFTLLNCTTEYGIWISDERGFLIWASSWYQKNLEWDMVDMVSSGWKNVIIESERDRVCKEFFDSVRDGRDFIMDLSYVHKNDSAKTIRVHAQCRPLRRSSGEIIGYIGFATQANNS